MKKQLLIIGITLLLLAVGFSGCTSEQEGAKTEIGDEDQLNGDTPSSQGKIAFISSESIHIINADGTNEVRLTGGFWPTLSPDGKKIAYLEIEEENTWYGYDLYRGDFYIINIDGTDKVKLAEDVDVGSYSWSPDGKKIAYTSGNSEDGLYGLYVVNSDGTDKIGLTEINPDYAYYSDIKGCGWSPDGKKILFERIELKHFQADYSEESGLYIINADGSDLIRLTENKVDFATFSPDGKIIYGDESTLYIMDSDGTDKKTLIQDLDTDNLHGFGCSPDGKKIAYCSEYEGIGVIDIDGTNKMKLATDVVYPAWSPDSKKIAYIQQKHMSLCLCIMNPDGTGKTEIIEGRIDFHSPHDWSPDGKKIVFSMDDPSNIYIVNVDGSGLTKLAQGSLPQWLPDLQP